MKFPKSLVTVTPFSKIIALFLFITLPFAGFYLGMQYQQTLDLIAKQQMEANLLVPRTPTPTPNQTLPEKVVQDFYNWYIDCGIKHNISPESCNYKTSIYISPELKNNDIMCASNFPYKVTVDKPIIFNETAIAVAHHLYYSSGDNPIKVELKSTNNQWKITNIICKS